MSKSLTLMKPHLSSMLELLLIPRMLTPVVQEQATTCFKQLKVLIHNTAYLQMFLLYGGHAEVDQTVYLH